MGARDSAMSSPKTSRTPLTSALRYKFIAILGPDHVHPAGPSDEILGVQPKLVVLPGSEGELAEILRLSNEAGLAVIPRGGGTKISWGNPPSRADLLLSTARLNNILEHASSDLTVTVEAGCTIKKLQETLVQHGQRLAIDPLWPEKATVGGILSTNDSGALRLRFGALRDLIIGVTIALPDGTLASSGGKVVKNVAGYDLPKLVTGALGTLGVIARAVFRLHPLPHNTRSFSIATAQPAATRDLVLAIQDSKLAHTALQSQFSDEALPTSDILFEGTEAGLEAQAAHLRNLCQPAEISVAQGSVAQGDSPEGVSAPTIWNARQDLWSFSDPAETAIAKISTLAADLARIIELFHHAADSYSVRWKSLIYATGLGWLRLEGPADNLKLALTNLRADLEKKGGSLVVLHRPAKLFALDAWGTPGDSLPLMKSLKHQLDPANTLNPGRFLGGI
jgi:glycolate oxidase FAD binding subunit